MVPVDLLNRDLIIRELWEQLRLLSSSLRLYEESWRKV